MMQIVRRMMEPKLSVFDTASGVWCGLALNDGFYALALAIFVVAAFVAIIWGVMQ